ncbi:ABC transporter ATP-binding protein [Paenibacillus koleovorans]|uniref:ABC transporter ATP-binding protein n=1 Tax=Paenibacillus koleovorans TaxID=121608 RepID=UPI000FD96631|nr:ABC transporter ATP-binding protein [Paenibacillus koleovorans]
MITVKGLRKSIEDRIVLANVHFALTPGSVAGLIGRNGAGKTTLLKTMAGILDPDMGTVEYEGVPVHAHPEVKRSIVFVPDAPEAFYGYTPLESAKLYAMIYPDFDMAFFLATLERFGLNKSRRVKQYSKGMRMLFSITLGLATRAKVVLLDEPTNGIDPIAKKQVLTLLMEAAEEGVTLVISSHLLDELERITDTVLLMKDGLIEQSMSADTMGDTVLKRQIVFRGQPPTGWLDRPDIHVLDHIGRVYTVLIQTERGAEALERLKAADPLLNEPLPVKLEDLFIWKLGGQANVE